MKENFTSFIQRLSLLLLFSILAVGAMAQTYKPYPVYFPIADYPEFNYGVVTSLPRASIPSMYWHSAASYTAASNCGSIAFKKLPSSSAIASPYGRGAALAIGQNRALYVDMMTPFVVPGTYRVYLGTTFSSGTARTFAAISVKMDSVLIQAPADTTLRFFFGGGSTTAPNKQSLKFTGTGTNRHYDMYCGKVTITVAGRHKFHFDMPNTGTGTEYCFTLLQLIPVTATDANSDYDYPKFDQGGNVYKSAADTLTITTNNTATTGYYLPYQATDSTDYTKYPVVLDAGLYFANKNVVVKRADDKWTRLFSGIAGADGKVTAQLPEGNYYVEVSSGLQRMNMVVTSSTSTIFVGVETGTVAATFSPENWYVGKTFKVWNSSSTVVLNEVVIPADGIIPLFALPVTTTPYVYKVLNNDSLRTTFEDGTIPVPNASNVTLNRVQPKQAITINLGADSYGANQAFTIKRYGNDNALFISGTTDASGAFNTQLPNGKYNFSIVSGMINKTFTVQDAALNLDLSPRYAANFCLGKTVAGAKVGVFISKTKALIATVTLDVDGKASFSGLTSNRYYHSMFNVNGADTTFIIKKFTFEIEGADFTIGDSNNPNQPYYLPYKVYFDICNQPEIKWRVDNGKRFTPGQLSRIKFDNVPIDTIYMVKDTTWIYTQGATKIDTTFTVNYDSTTINTITYFNWDTYYGFNGVTPSSTADNYYVWGDQFNFRLAPKSKLTFVTPILNPGRYNVYMSTRWKGNMGTPDIDTTYMDGKPLLITDGKKRSFKGWGDNTTYRVFVANGKQQGLHLGEALVTKPGEHELSLYSIVGSTGSIGQESQIWGSMIYFIPVDQDSVGINVTYYPRIDYTGRIIYRNASEGPTVAQTNLGTDGVNRPKYFSQFADPSILSNGVVNYSKTLTVNGGIYSRGDVLTAVSPIDNWTTKSVSADTINGIATVALLPNDKPYSWAMDKEGVYSKAVVNSDQTITIPTVINTSITSSYTITPNVDDPAIGTYTFNSTVKTEPLPFFYPINGVVFYTKNGDIIKLAGDTIYKPKADSLNGIAPAYGTDLEISPYTLASIYTGNGARLQPANGTVTSIKKATLAAGGIYPNPARETMNLKLNENAGVANFAIYNQLGQVVRRGSFTGTEHSASLNGVSKGMYIVSVKVNGKNWNTKLLVE